MNTYRSTQTIQAVQFTGDAIPEVTCGGSPAEVLANGCDSSRKQHIHVHTQATGGMTVLQSGDWVFPVPGGPWGTASDAKFRAHWEVPAAIPAPEVAPSEEATFSETAAISPVDVVVVPAVASEPGPVIIPVPVPHAHVPGPETAVGEGLVSPPTNAAVGMGGPIVDGTHAPGGAATSAPTNPAIFTD